ncbi:MAG: hypothetical protein KDB60_16695 [Propionibacteriaceae bacterium]|nr:hypothetical protein [Propionibacteriaceae bacterium]
MGGGAQDVPQLRGVRQRMQVGGRRRIAGREGRVPRRLGGRTLRGAMGLDGGGALQARPGGTGREDPGGVQRVGGARVVRRRLREQDERGLGARRGEPGHGTQLLHRQLEVRILHPASVAHHARTSLGVVARSR